VLSSTSTLIPKTPQTLPRRPSLISSGTADSYFCRFTCFIHDIRLSKTLLLHSIPECPNSSPQHTPIPIYQNFQLGLPYSYITISGRKSKRKTRKTRFYAILSYLQQIKPPRAPRQPLGEISPNQRSRVVSAREYGVKFPVIARMECLQDSTVRSIVRNMLH
jgi:hypothetical protein